jgi:hypothetical protein
LQKKKKTNKQTRQFFSPHFSQKIEVFFTSNFPRKEKKKKKGLFSNQVTIQH